MGVQYRLGAIDGNCGWCGDFGENSSFLPAEKAKVIAAKFSVKVSIKEGNIPCSNFSYSDLECIVDRWTAEELENMDTQDLLSETGEKDPEAAIDMMKLLLDTVGDKLQEREVAYQFLGWDMDGLLREPTVQVPLLQRLKTDDRLARQIFQCACWDTGQKLLYGACDTFNEPELKEKLRTLAEENPCFDGFD